MIFANEPFLKLLNIDFRTAYGGGWINRINNFDADRIRERISDAIETHNIELDLVFRLSESRTQNKARLKIGRDDNKKVIFILGTIETTV